MTDATSPDPIAPASPAAQWAATLAVPLLALLVGGVFLPRPVPVAEERKQVDRGALQGVIAPTKPTPQLQVDAVLGGIRVLGADLPTEPLRKGATLRSTLYFEVLEAQTRDWTVFVHGDGKGGADFRIHGEHPPAKGRFPTTLWEKGDFVVDAWETRVPLEAPAGTYDVWVGFYIGDDRLPFVGGDRAVTDGHHRVKVGTIRVE